MLSGFALGGRTTCEREQTSTGAYAGRRGTTACTLFQGVTTGAMNRTVESKHVNERAPMSTQYDVEFFWDPVCPFAWITSRWVAKVAAQTGYQVDWRLISLRLLNKQKDYATEFPPTL